MLRVSIHAGPLKQISRFNLVAWVDIAYEKLEPIANYKTVLFEAGRGANYPVPLDGYPRWSTSLWDLIARALALGLTDQDNPTEAVPELLSQDKQFAFANEICALIEHFPASSTSNRKTLGSVDIRQQGRSRGTYIARFDEHTMPRQATAAFKFTPAYLRPPELLLHACLMRLTGTRDMPPRPALCIPDPIEIDGLNYVALHHLVEPARTGFLSWLHRFSEPPTAHESAPLGIAPETMYVRFLQEAV